MLKIILIMFLLPLVSALTCPGGYSYYSMTQKCYKVITDASPYFAAVDVCQQDGGSLVSIHNAFENTYISSLVSNNNLNHWIGLTNMITGYDFEWLDKSPKQYTNWIPGEPNYDTSCVFIEAVSGYWASNNCRDFLPFICEYDPAAAHSSCPACPTTSATVPPICPIVTTQKECPACPTQTTTACPTVTTGPTCPAGPACATCPPPPTCPPALPCTTPVPKPICDDGWTYLNSTDSCYFMGDEGELDNSVAQARCREKDSYLTSIHSNAENFFIMNFIYSAMQPAPTWIGLYELYVNPNLINFENYDGTPVDYTNWAPGLPDYNHTDELCTLMMVNGEPSWPDGSWDEFWCYIPRLHYVCKKPSNKN